ncbi:MarR family transcriptional regulator [Streptomyces sp. NPDC002896]|uniref:MarR family winged helix-turn-helix transcriptional regulator n=1 Tax=Streptomyces sp. NPDC002896 TaxID=3154438 RepID=UPI00332F8514
MEEEHQAGDVVAFLDGLALLAVRHLTVRDMSITAAATLSRLARSGPVRLTKLAESEGVSQPSMTQLVQRLTKQGLVKRISDPDDGRVVLVSITDSGRRLSEERRRKRGERFADLLETLPAEDRQALADAARVGLPVLGRLVESALRAENPADDTSS